jgi:hypothetical protein
VKVNASCGDETCTLSGEGKLTKVKKDKLKPASADLGPGETTTLKLFFTKKSQRPRDPQGARRGREGQGEGHRPRDGCGRQRGDREAHDHARIPRPGPRVGTTQAPKPGWTGPPSFPGRIVRAAWQTALEAAGCGGRALSTQTS